MMPLQFVGSKSMFDVCTIVVEPNLFCGLPLGKKQHIGLHPLRIKYTGRQTEDSVQVEIREQFLAYRFAGTTFKKYIIRQYHGGAASHSKHQHHVLEKVQLIVLCLHIEIRTIQFHRTGRSLPERRVCKYHIHKNERLILQRIPTNNRTSFSPHTMQIEIHRGKSNDQWRIVHAMQSLVAQEIALLLACRLPFHVVVSRK